MKIRLAAAALSTVALPTFAIQFAAAQQAAPSMTAGATLAEKHVQTLLKSAAPGAKMDYSILTTEVGKAVRDHPEGGDMIIKLGTPQSVTYLGDPPGGYLFRITFATAKIDFFLALNAAGKISAMYYHPAISMPS
ncbi:hypothetical protein ASE69_11130 [Sphingomonas sp. Leaf208]|uniref:hypothetical protein n=1 Tax=Sphingomonas sp. Leaf208 TaxID=1735679 RepID=UPI0006FBDEF5|nr:hypothetical protein [Sphingomonas sp. Leaf208]KQM49317.1 hypothetical protein ASE69_11130 [Sphingomonas sp. Leaf208]